jgi:uncharacterized protein YbjT (DUF2867 family)
VDSRAHRGRNRTHRAPVRERRGTGPMQKRILLAGASGTLGTAVAVELKHRGYWIRALTRQVSRVSAAVDETFVGDLVDPGTLVGVCDGVDLVFSCAGAPSTHVPFLRGRHTFAHGDDAGNRNLLAVAQSAGVRRFGYVSVFGGASFGDNEYISAHESFAAALSASGIDHLIIRPTSFFSSFVPLLEKARRGKITVVDYGAARTNPIDEEELAVASVDAFEGHGHELELGGPVIYTRRRIAELAIEASGTSAKLRSVHGLRAACFDRLSRVRGRHNHAVSQFLTATAITDTVAPSYGARRLEDYFAAAMDRVRV